MGWECFSSENDISFYLCEIPQNQELIPQIIWHLEEEDLKDHIIQNTFITPFIIVKILFWFWSNILIKPGTLTGTKFRIIRIINFPSSSFRVHIPSSYRHSQLANWELCYHKNSNADNSIVFQKASYLLSKKEFLIHDIFWAVAKTYGSTMRRPHRE